MSGLDSLFKKAAAAEQPLAPTPKVESKPPATPVKPATLGGLKLGVMPNAQAKPPSDQPAESARQQDSQQTTEHQQAATPPSTDSEAKASSPSGESTRADTHSGFPDERPATQPIRELPSDADEETKRFVELLDSIHGLTPEPELASSAIKNIMIELKHQPQYIKHISPDDVRMLVRIMRENMGLVKIQKAEKKASRGKSKRADADMADDLASLGFSLDE